MSSVMSSEMENAKKPEGPQAPGKKNQTQTPETEKQTYCILCRKMYWKHDAQEHMHSMLHHQELDTVVGTGAFHECHACKVSAMGLNEYSEHILTAQHTTNLENLKSSNVKAISLHKTLSAETINRILERNKKLKSVEKKAMKKKKKKEKQAAAQQLAETQQKAASVTLPTTSELRKSKQALAEILKQMQEARHAGINMAVIQNKENKESRVDEPFCLPESLLPIESGTFDHWPGEAWNQSTFSYRNMQYDSTQEKDFTDDQLPQSGAIIFGRNTQSPQQEIPAQFTSTKPAMDDLFRDVDVSSMLRHIRRVLGVREPCRAEREARQQSNNAAGVSITQRSVDVSSTPTTSSTSGQPEQASFDGTPEEIQYPGENSGAAVPLSQAASEHMYKLGKVRIAHTPGKASLNTEARLRPTLNRLLQLSGARSSLNWSQMWSNIRKKQMKGMNRFGLEMMKHPADQQSSTQAEDSDVPLSEGFHWESIPDSPLDPDLMPSFQGTADVDDPAEEEFDSQVAGHVEQPASAQPSCSGRSGAGVMMKMETGVGGQEFSNNSHTAKRKCNSGTEDGVSENIPKRKKKKKSNKGQDQMDQLLTVSLREEELNYTLQDLDSSLIQARGALQAAYAEVQRIVLLKQQCAVEVNSLRARRIEILQNMQEGFSGLTCAPEAATTSSGVKRPPTLPPSDAIPTPSSQPASAATAPSPVAQLEPSAQALSVKKERCNLPTARLPSDSAGADPLLSASLSDAAEQHTAECSSSANTAPATESSAGQDEQEIWEDGGEAFLAEDPQTAQNDDAEDMEGNLSMEATIEDIFGEESKDDKGNESDNSVEVIHSKTEIIAIEESDYEESSETKSNIPAGADELENSVSLELSSVSAQTAQQSDPDKKTELLSFEAEDANSLEESAGEEQPSVGSFLNHAGPVNGLQVHDGLLYTCSGDFTARAYCLVTRECKAVFDGHTNKINCLLLSSLPNKLTRLYTGSSDQTIRSFSIRSQKCLEQISLPDRVLCLHIAWNILYVGIASGSVFSYDLKTLKELDVFDCHGPRGVSCIGTAQEGARRLLLVGSYDSTISVRDAKSGLLLRSLEGHTKTVLCMKVVNDLVFSGSSDTSVHAHNIHTGELVRIYKGHGHAVTAIVILGKVMVTACLDKLVRVFELQSHDRLQVYGGHSDMVMCMAVHKSVIYTGCYDGSVQAVKLNLMKNYRCWWQNCSLIFGMPEHLAQHLTGDHSNPNLQTIKCRWKGCNTFFATQELIKEKLPEHMQKHVEDDSSVQP